MRAQLVLLALTFPLFAACTERDATRSETTTLVRYQTCEDLERDLQDLFIQELYAQIEMAEANQSWGWGGLAEDSDSTTGGDSGDRDEGTDYSGTNNQESGVDEADLVKTDGYHIYLVNGRQLRIFGTPEFGDLVPEGGIDIDGYPRELVLAKDSDRVAVFSYVDPWSLAADDPLRDALGIEEESSGWNWRVQTLTKVTVISVADPQDPVVEREIWLEGWYDTARLVDGSLRMASWAWLWIPGLDDWWWYWNDVNHDVEVRKNNAVRRIRNLGLDDIIPRLYSRLPGGELQTHSFGNDECRDFSRPSFSTGRGFASILTLDLFQAPPDEGNDWLAPSLDVDHVLSNWPTFYASLDRMVIASPSHAWWWFWWSQDDDEQSDLHMFDTSVAGTTTYLGSGRVDGTLHNQFSLSIYEGVLRVATTLNRWNRWWEADPPPSTNHVFTLGLKGQTLQKLGHVGDLAEGERIFAARFTGDRAYLVTFQNIDPLWTIDLSNPWNPRVTGELEVPGVSTYIHPIGQDLDRLLTIGMAGDADGLTWRTQISLFDVSNQYAPSLQDAQELALESGYSWSEAQYEHHAFTYWAPKKLLAVPVSSWSYSSAPDGSWDYQYLTRLELVSVDVETGLDRYGSIDHGEFYPSGDYYWYYIDVRRSIFMGDYIYAISDRGITVHEVETLTKVASEPLIGWTY